MNETGDTVTVEFSVENAASWQFRTFIRDVIDAPAYRWDVEYESALRGGRRTETVQRLEIEGSKVHVGGRQVPLANIRTVEARLEVQ